LNFFTDYEIVNIGTRKQPVTIAVRKQKKQDEMISLHPGSSVFVSKPDLLNIFTEKSALYTARLTTLVFGENVLKESRMPEDKNADPSLKVLQTEILDSIICMKI
jgi:hypothetical protein